MAYGETAPELAPCSFCGYANWAGAARCLQCGLPVDLVQCATCEAVNRSEAAACTHCGAALAPIDASDRAGPHRLLNSSVSPPSRLGDVVGTCVGYGVVLAAVAFATYAVIATHAHEARGDVRYAIPAALELVASTSTTDMRPPSFIAIETAAPVLAVARAVSTTRTHKVRTRIKEPPMEFANAAAMDVSAPSPSPAPVLAAAGRVTAQVPVPVQAGKQSYCTSSAVAANQCRPEQLWTGQ